MNNFLKYPLTSKNKIIKFEDIKGIKLGGFTTNSNEPVELYRYTGSNSYVQINGTQFNALKDELVPIIIDFDNYFANEHEPVIRFTIDHNNTYENEDDIYSNYYFDIENKIITVINGICYSPYFKYNSGPLMSIIPKSIILRNGEELEFIKNDRFIIYKNNNAEILVSTDASKDFMNLYFNVIPISKEENIISIIIEGLNLTVYNDQEYFIISSVENYNEAEGEEGGEKEGEVA